MSKKQQKKPTQLENLTESVSQDYAHMHTSTIASQRRIYMVEVEELEKRLTALAAAITTTRARRAELLARVAGLSAVVAKR